MTFKNKTAACTAFTEAATVQCIQHGGWAHEDWAQQKAVFIAECEAKLRPGETVVFTTRPSLISAEITNDEGKRLGLLRSARPVFARQRTGKFRAKGARYTFEFLHTTGKVETSEGLVKILSLTPDGTGLEFTNASGDRMVYSLPTDAS